MKYHKIFGFLFILADERGNLVERYKRMIEEILPDRVRAAVLSSRNRRGHSIASDKELLDTLKSLGYIK